MSIVETSIGVYDAIADNEELPYDDIALEARLRVAPGERPWNPEQRAEIIAEYRREMEIPEGVELQRWEPPQASSNGKVGPLADCTPRYDIDLDDEEGPSL